MLTRSLRRFLAQVPRSSRSIVFTPDKASSSPSSEEEESAKREIIEQLKGEKKAIPDREARSEGYRNASGRLMRSNSDSVSLISNDVKKLRTDINKYYLHCLTSHSNTLLTLTNWKHEPVLWTSAGLCGFKKAARGGYEAGFRSTTMMLEKMRQREEDDAAFERKSRLEPQRVQKTQLKKQKLPFRPYQIDLIIKDFGSGREAVMKAIMGVEGDHYRNKIAQIIDATPLKFGGVRARAVRRL